ncbi:putative outer membrane porin HofQ [Achromobacter xylosoxidans]|uniref:hypothetical protein n=1 Tax=Achromobacter TaxID=222 RepID=UPI0006C44095|nr:MULTISPECIES: hypothetical protein [Achromobacter]CAB3919481.1 Type 3 secretion system secretin [Achromobacter insuavis]CUJ32883.1 putative outer membrane porin HofQ [Achromobacter xylosoxidans]CUJ40261.1 putative outer membrane porin HofQ [Achromobacter sp. 2789STDY5608621]
MIIHRIFIAAAASSLLVACATNYDKEAREFHEGATKGLDDVKEQQRKQEEIVRAGEVPLEFKRLSEAEQEAKQHAWLRAKKVTYVPKNAVSAMEILKVLRAHGINIATSLPLDNYLYSGLGVTQLDGETALKTLLLPMGLDYQLDNQAKVVEIIPMRSQTWTINIGNRTSSYSSATTDIDDEDGSPTGAGMGGVGNTGAANRRNSSDGDGGNKNMNTVTSTDNFWKSLSNELCSRLATLIPTAANNNGVSLNAAPQIQGGSPIVPGINPGMAIGGRVGADAGGGGAASCGGQSAGGNSLYTATRIGLPSMNPETGAITIQAPGWLMKQISPYMDSIQAKYNTQITFDVEVVEVTTSKRSTRGLDIASFARFAKGRYGAVVTNNILGGATISFPGGGSQIPSVNVPSTSLAATPTTLLGVSSAADGLQIFNAYMDTQENTRTIQKPTVSTTSGSPAEFDYRTTGHYTINSQQAAYGTNTGAAATATQNILVPYSTGMRLRINPRYDSTSGIVRAQVSMLLKKVVGWDSSNQVITAGEKVVQIPQRIPIINKQTNNAEVVLRDGDLILLGGLSQENTNDLGSGIPGLKDVPVLSAVFGNENNSGSKTSMYLVLRVGITKRN